MSIESFKLIPANSITSLPEETRLLYLENILSLPENAQNILLSDSTGAYIQGLAKSNRIASENASKIGLAILEVIIKKKEISDLSTIFSKELGLSIDTALQIASEIDQDLFAPIQSELDAFRAQQSAPVVSPAKQADAPLQQPERRQPNPARTRNVLDLKELSARPEQKDLPTPTRQERIAPPKPRPIQNSSRIVDLKNTPRSTTAPHPSPLPEQERGTTAPKPPEPPKRTFPLPPSQRS
jgi:hypothetical protein